MRNFDQVGRIVIPKELRDKYNLKNGSAIRIEDGDGFIKIIPGRTPDYIISEQNMDCLRKIYINLKENNLVEENVINQFGKIIKVTNNTCVNCGSNLFITNDNKYECIKCK